MQNRENSQSKKIAFFADVMLGSLAKWLRILGYDTSYEQTITSEKLVSASRDEKRVILTRNKSLVKTLDKTEYLFIENNSIVSQLKQVIDNFSLVVTEKFLTRCTECNSEKIPANKEELRNEVPDFVFRTQNEFSKCPVCGKIFWKGTHLKRMEEILENLKKPDS